MCFQDLGRRKREKEEEAVGLDFEPWSLKRGEILARFTTTEKLSIVSPLSQQQGYCYAYLLPKGLLSPNLMLLENIVEMNLMASPINKIFKRV